MSEAAHERLQWLKAWQRLREAGYSAQRAADILRVLRSTLYRWQKRVEERGLIGLEDGDRRSKRVRRPQWRSELAEADLKLREEHPGMGKEKLWKLLQREAGQLPSRRLGGSSSGRKQEVCLENHLEMGSPDENADWCAPTPCGSRRSTGRRNQGNWCR